MTSKDTERAERLSKDADQWLRRAAREPAGSGARAQNEANAQAAQAKIRDLFKAT